MSETEQIEGMIQEAGRLRVENAALRRLRPHSLAPVYVLLGVDVALNLHQTVVLQAAVEAVKDLAAWFQF